MTGQSSEYQSRLAAALDVWADARERAVVDLSEQAAGLAQAGRAEDVTRVTIVSRHLRIKAMNERANAVAIRLNLS